MTGGTTMSMTSQPIVMSTSGSAMASAVAQAGQPGYSDDLLFLLMGELASINNDKLASQVQQFEQNTKLQQKYARFRKVMSTVQKLEQSGGPEFEKNGIAKTEQLRRAGLSQAEIDSILHSEGASHVEPNGVTAWTPEELAVGLNHVLFGDDQSAYVTGITLDDFPHGGDSISDIMETEVFSQIEQAQSANVGDTTLLSTAISQTVNEMNRMNNMFSKILQKLDEGQMSIIRNM